MSAPSGPAADLVAELLPRCDFAPSPAPITCAVSGGADSLSLLILAAAAHDDVTAVHVDHGLRDGSDREADLVEAVAALVGASFRSVRVEVAPGSNLEARARAARYAALPQGCCTGHTADDQAETVLLQILRGAGLDGVAAMRADGRRPILGLRRADTRALCEAAGLVPFEDPSNGDPAFRRNRVRHEVLPLLDDVAGRDLVPLLVRLAGHARDATDHLAEQAAAIDPTDAAVLGGAPPTLARLAVRSWLRACSPDRHPPDSRDRRPRARGGAPRSGGHRRRRRLAGGSHREVLAVGAADRLRTGRPSTGRVVSSAAVPEAGATG